MTEHPPGHTAPSAAAAPDTAGAEPVDGPTEVPDPPEGAAQDPAGAEPAGDRELAEDPALTARTDEPGSAEDDGGGSERPELTGDEVAVPTGAEHSADGTARGGGCEGPPEVVRLAAAVAELDELGRLPVPEHVPRYDALHGELSEALATIDEV